MAKPEYIYGIHAVESLLEAQPERILSLFVMQDRQDKRLQSLIDKTKPHGISLQPTARAQLDRLTQNAQHQGVVAKVQSLHQYFEDDLFTLVENTPSVKLLILDQVTDPHNLGACIRTAAAMGFNAVVAPKDRAAGLTPVAIKVAAGATEKIPFIQVTNLARTIKELQDQGVFVVGTVLSDGAKPLHQLNLTGNLAVVMGAEDTGLRRLTQEGCDQLAFIPMAGDLQSLNVSVAAGMAIYEVMRQEASKKK